MLINLSDEECDGARSKKWKTTRRRFSPRLHEREEQRTLFASPVAYSEFFHLQDPNPIRDVCFPRSAGGI